MAVQLDGKDVVAIAYVQTDKGNGTQKAKGQVLFQWLDADRRQEGRRGDRGPHARSLGPGGGGDDVVSQAYDAATGQVAVGVSAGSDGSRKKAGDVHRLRRPEDAEVVRSSRSSPRPACSNGMVAGAKGSNAGGRHDGTIVIADGASGKITQADPDQAGLPEAGRQRRQARLPVRARRTSRTRRRMAYGLQQRALLGRHRDRRRGPDRSRRSSTDDDAVLQVPRRPGQRGRLHRTGTTARTSRSSASTTTPARRPGATPASRPAGSCPSVTAAFHGVVYAKTDAQPVLLDATTGEDIPTSDPTAPSTATPSDSTTPTALRRRTTAARRPDSGSDPGSAYGSDMSLYDGKPRSRRRPRSRQYGGAYLQSARRRAATTDRPDRPEADRLIASDDEGPGR